MIREAHTNWDEPEVVVKGNSQHTKPRDVPPIYRWLHRARASRISATKFSVCTESEFQALY